MLLIVADDLNTELGCYGSPNVHTPNIDRLAKKGVLFSQNHCQFPLCAPSRVSFLSGRRPDTTGVYTLKTPTRLRLKDAVMLPELFRQHGHFSAHAGKIYHTGELSEDPRSWDEELRDFGKKPPKAAILQAGKAAGPKGHTFEWDCLNLADDQMPDGITTAKAISYMERSVANGKPFFVGAGFRRPHAPYAAPKKYFDSHPWQETSLPADPPGQFSRLLSAAINYAPPDHPLSDTVVRQYRAAYFACVAFVDGQIGRLLDAMDRLNLWGNTAVVFTADHGYHLGDHGGLWHKLTLFENSTRVPLVVYAPGYAGNSSRCHRVTESVDIYPTVAEICGLDAPSGLEGTSLVPLLKNPRDNWRDFAHSLVGRGTELAEAPEQIAFFGRTVRTAQWRYTEWDGGQKGTELYNHIDDPGELNNLAGKGGPAGEQEKKLKAFLR